MKIKTSTPYIFVGVSGVIFLLVTYLLVTKTSKNNQLFISACGKFLKSINWHAHLNLNNVISLLVLLVVGIGVNLALGQLIRFLIAHHKLQQIKPNSKVPYKLQWVINRHNLQKNSILVKEDSTLSAYTIGLFKSKIVISKSLINNFTKLQLEAVVLHELYHVKNRHVLWLLSSRIVSSLFFFTPLVRYLAYKLKTEFELKADSFVVSKQKTKKHLCDSLALNIQYVSRTLPNFTTSPIETRVDSLVKNNISFNRISIKQLVVSGLSFAVMLSVVFVQPSQISAKADVILNSMCKTNTECQPNNCTSYKTLNLNNTTTLIPLYSSPQYSY